MKEYRREEYERVEGGLARAVDRDAEMARQRETTSELEKLPVITYQSVTELLRYLRGETTSQAQRKLNELRDLAHGEAQKLNERHDLLTANVVNAWSVLQEAVTELKAFDSEIPSERSS